MIDFNGTFSMCIRKCYCWFLCEMVILCKSGCNIVSSDQLYCCRRIFGREHRGDSDPWPSPPPPQPFMRVAKGFIYEH